MNWQPGAKRDWRHLGLGVIALFVLGLGVTVWEKRAAITEFLISTAPWWFIWVAPGVIGLVFIGWLIWWQSRPAPPHIFCAEESRKPWEEVE